MRSRFRPSPAMIVACIALFVALGGTATAVTYVVSSNSQVGPGTISGHKPPTGKHANIIAGSVNGTDIANQGVTPAKLSAPEAWHQVGAGSSTQNLCSNASKTAVFCSYVTSQTSAAPWQNYGAPFATAGFYKDQLGIVHLKGLVSNGSFQGPNPQTIPIFRLPPAYAPTNERVFPSVGRNADGQELSQSRIDVQPNGLVIFLQDCQAVSVDCSADGSYITLDAISFRRAG
jgi:hypothetical protein